MNTQALTISDIVLYLSLIGAVIGLVKSKKDIVNTINQQAEAEAKWQTTMELTLQTLKDNYLLLNKKMDDVYTKMDTLDKEVFVLKHVHKNSKKPEA